MTLCCAVISFSSFTLPYAGVAPHPPYILRRLRSSEDFGGNFCSSGAKNHRYFFFFVQYVSTDNWICFVHISLFLRWVALLSVHNLKIHNLQLHGQNPSPFTRVPFSRVLKVSCRDDNVAAYLFRNFIDQCLGRSSSSAYEKWSFCAKRMTRANVLAGRAIFVVVIAYAYCDLFRFYFCFYFFDLNWKYTLQIFKRSVINHGSTAKNDSKQVFIALDFF